MEAGVPRVSSQLFPCLRPRSKDSQRNWLVGPTQDQRPSPNEVWLDVLPDSHGSFASLRSILHQLSALGVSDAARAALRSVEDGLAHVYSTGAEAPSDGTRTRFLADSVTFAIMRRISRESAYTAPVIDSAARAINAALATVQGCRAVHVPNIDRLDRPTLKVLARAVLLLGPAHGFSWVWHSECNPAHPASSEGTDLYVVSRGRLLQQLVGLLDPIVDGSRGARPLTRPVASDSTASPLSAAMLLVMQNYDACLLECARLIDTGNTQEAGEALRLSGLCAINIGQIERGLELLAQSEELAVGPARRAHLAYLQGLTESKRTYDLAASDAHYRRGLAALEDATSANGDDHALERAWLLNGLALNEAILWRREPDQPDHEARAFALEREAFDLVHEGMQPARVYLRFNLIANSALLLEMQRRSDLAEQLFRRAFEFPAAAGSTAEANRWTSTVSYRIGVLQFRDGRLEESAASLEAALDVNTHEGSWATQDVILRALGAVAYERGAFGQARYYFARGVDLCRDARAAQGLFEHGRGLVATLLADDKFTQARDVYEELLEDEGIDVTGIGAFPSPESTLRPVPPSPKLPAYVPEVDLEDIPTIDLNRFLSAAPSGRAPAVSPWRS